MNFYNEIDPGKAAWLRELIRRDVISPGRVEERSVLELSDAGLVRYRQFHFFAGIGIWSYALRLAGWPDDREVWTGSCPCQPFSVAGQGKGTADERHLWPAWFRLISLRRPVVVFGEQVADGDGQTWLDAVQSDMESIDYRFGSVALPAAGFGAPHGRHRTFFVADTADRGTIERRQAITRGNGPEVGIPRENGESSILANASEFGHDGRRASEANGAGRYIKEPERLCTAGELGDANEAGLAQQRSNRGISQGQAQPHTRQSTERAGSPTNGFWHDAEWLPCTDGKARAVEPGTFPLAHGAPARVLRLRGFGDGIVASVAAEFIKAYIETQQPLTPLNDA